MLRLVRRAVSRYLSLSGRPITLSSAPRRADPCLQLPPCADDIGAFFRKRCDRNRPCLRDVAALAEEFTTSLTATALRFVRFTPEPCAVVHSTDGAVDWLDWSSNFQLAIKKGTRLDGRTYAGDLSAGKPVDDRPGQVDGEAWSNSRDAADLDIFEHSKKVSPRSVLTFLWHADR